MHMKKGVLALSLAALFVLDACTSKDAPKETSSNVAQEQTTTQAPAPAKDINIVVDMEVSKGKTAELYVNQDLNNPLRMDIQPGKRKTYTFKAKAPNVSGLRFDPTDEVNSKIHIFSIRLESEGISQEIQDLQGTSLVNARKNRGVSDAGDLEITSTNADPILYPTLNGSFPSAS